MDQGQTTRLAAALAALLTLTVGAVTNTVVNHNIQVERARWAAARAARPHVNIVPIPRWDPRELVCR